MLKTQICVTRLQCVKTCALVCAEPEYRDKCKNVKKNIRIIFVRIILSTEHCVGGIPTAVRVGSEHKTSELSTQTQHFGTKN